MEFVYVIFDCAFFQILLEEHCVIFSCKRFLLCYSFISSCDYTTTPSPKLTLILKNSFTCWIARKWIELDLTD